MALWAGGEKWEEVIGVEWAADGGNLGKDGVRVAGDELGTVKHYESFSMLLAEICFSAEKLKISLE